MYSPIRVSCFLLNAFFCAFFCMSLSLHAEEQPPKRPRWMTRNYLTLSWNTALPVGRSFNETPRLSLAGAGASFHIRLNQSLSVGPSVAFQLLETRTTHTRLSSQNSSQTLVSWTERRLLAPSIALHRYFFKRETMLPYLGAHLGALRVRERIGLTISSPSPQWHPLLSAEAGIILLHGRIPFVLNAQISWATPTRNASYEMFGLFSFGITVPN